jgi:uncharacterized protein with FMN-binding domain
MKKIFLSFSVIVAFALIATFSRRNVGIGIDRFLTPNPSVLSSATDSTLVVSNTSVPETPPNQSVPVSNPVKKTTTPSPSPKKPTPTPAPAPTPKATGQYTDGAYTGSVSDAYYGNIQVKAIIQSGKLADVIFLQYPNDRSTSVEINRQAMPYLKQEAIQAQNAKVNTVSGATDSSGAFRESLSSALAQAKI